MSKRFQLAFITEEQFIEVVRHLRRDKLMAIVDGERDREAIAYVVYPFAGPFEKILNGCGDLSLKPYTDAVEEVAS